MVFRAYPLPAVIAILGTLVCAMPVTAQPVAEKPALAIGDTWQFRSLTEPTEKSDTWSRTVVEIPSAGHVRVRFGGGAIHDYDDAMNFLQKGRLDLPLLLVKYPLKVGDKWKFEEINHENPNAYESGSATVVGYEELTVPAGTFSCYRVDASSSYVNRANFMDTRRWTRWYCPEIKWMAKEIYERQTYSRFNPAATNRTVQSSELVSFTSGK